MTSALQAPPPEAVEHTGRIDVEKFNFWYGKNQALYDIDMAITPRAVTALIGPSGCGKSTFLRSINRLNELIPGARRKGEIRLDGENIYQKGMDVVTLRQRNMQRKTAINCNARRKGTGSGIATNPEPTPTGEFPNRCRQNV